MISAPNRRRQLSGSKLWVVLVSLLLIGACASQKNAGSGAPKGYEVIDTKNSDPSKAPKPPKLPKDTIMPPTGTLLDSVGRYSHKPFYNVALILPFYLDSFPTANGGIYPQSRIGTEYYKGVLAALDTLKQNGLSIKLHVYDSYPETYLDVLIKGGQLKTMDLIIGPVFNSSMKLMAKYALAEEIPIWSPFSPATDITAQNPYFYISNPRQETHALKMIEFAVDSFKEDNIVVLYQFSEQEKTFLAIYRQYVKTYNESQPDKSKIKLREKFIENSGNNLPKISTSEMESLLDGGKRNVILVPSMKIPFLVNLLRELFPLSNKYHISLIGTPTMGNDVDLQVDYLNALDVHFTQSYYLKPGFYESPFYKSFLAQFGLEPSEYAINGYDQMLFLGNMMRLYGESFRVEMTKVTYNAWGTGFSMRPVVLDPNNPIIEYWDNQNLYILRYKDFTIEKVR